MRTGKGHIGAYRCVHCQRLFHAAAANAVRCCGNGCEAGLKAKEAELRQELHKRGFEPHPAAANALVKDGYTITIEEARHVGVDEAVSRLARWAERGAQAAAKP